MTLAQTSLGAVVLLPLLASAVAVLLPAGGRRVLGIVTAATAAALSAAVVIAVSGGDAVELSLGGHVPPLGIMLRADGLSAVFLALTAVVGALVTLYAAALPAATGGSGFWPLWLGCWAGLNAVFLSGDLFNTYVGLELVGLTAVGLVALGGRDSWTAALRYLFIAVAGSLLLLLGVGLLVSISGTLDIAATAEAVAAMDDPLPALLALILATAGLALKMALVPLHRWLIPAHAGAPSAVSPLLSGLVIKAALFVMLRLWLWVVHPGADSAALTLLAPLTWLLAGLGAAALILGSAMALRQNHLKPLIAYSTVAQIGYWTLFLPILVDPQAGALEGQPGTTLDDDAVLGGALAGTVALALGHGIAKACLFLAAGTLKEIYGTDEIRALRGVGQEHPSLVLSTGLAAVGIAGLPVSLGFLGKWQLATSAVAAEHFWILVVLVVGTLLSAAYLLRAVAPLLVKAEDDDDAVRLPQRHLESVPATAKIVPLMLGCLVIITGLLGAGIDHLLSVGAPW